MRPGVDSWRKGRVCQRCGHVTVLDSPHDCDANLAAHTRDVERYRRLIAEAEAAGDVQAARNAKIRLGQILGEVIP